MWLKDYSPTDNYPTKKIKNLTKLSNRGRIVRSHFNAAYLKFAPKFGNGVFAPLHCNWGIGEDFSRRIRLSFHEKNAIEKKNCKKKV